MTGHATEPEDVEVGQRWTRRDVTWEVVRTLQDDVQLRTPWGTRRFVSRVNLVAWYERAL